MDGRARKMKYESSVKRLSSSRLPNSLKMLCGIANLRYPDELVQGEDQYITKELQAEFTQRARKLTKNFWPELWEDETRALSVLRHMRNLLRAFWDARNEHARDWHIHRAREYYQRFIIQRQVRDQLDEAKNKPTKEEALDALSWVLIDIDRRLNEPPEANPFERALFSLQRRAYHKSLAPHLCEMKCIHPYFLKTKEFRKYCSPECYHESKKRSGRESWQKHKDEWRKRNV